MIPRPTLLAGVLAATFLLAGCAQVPPRLPAPETPQTPLPQGLLALSPSTVTHLSETEPVPSSPRSGAVLGLHFSSDTGVLQAVYEARGTLVRWDMRNRRILSEYPLGITTSQSLRFDTSGTMVLGALTSDPSSQGRANPDDYLSSVEIWDTLSGDSLYCVVRPCDEASSKGTTSQHPSLSIGADMNRAGTWALDYSATAISFDGLRGNGRGHTLLLEDPDHRLRIANVALDATGARYAIAFQQGPVTVRRRWIDPLGLLLAIELSGDADEDVAVPNMRFSNAGTYLAAVRDDSLIVWELGLFSGNKVMEESILGALLLEFSATDDLLAVATLDSIFVFDLLDGSLVTSIRAPDLTSMAFDTANFHLVWGDIHGMVHLLQVEAGHAIEPLP